MQAVGHSSKIKVHGRKECGDIAADRAEVMLHADINHFDEAAFIIIDKDVRAADRPATNIKAVVSCWRSVGDARL